MLIRTSLLLLALSFALAEAGIEINVVGDQLSESKFPVDAPKLRSLEEFVNLVNQNNLNVSLIVSTVTKHKNGKPKEVVAMTVTFPTPANSTPISETTLTKEKFQPLLRAASKEKLAVAATRTVNDDLKVYTNFPEGIPVNKAVKLLTSINNGKTGFVFDDDNYAAQYTYLSKDDDGKKQTTKVLIGDLKSITVVAKENLNKDEVELIKKILVKHYFTYSEAYTARATSYALAKELPLPDGNYWDVVYEVDEHSYLDSNKWVHFKILNNNFFIYSVY